MYQLIPYIERLVALEQRLGDTPLARLGVARPARRTGSSTASRSWPDHRPASGPSTNESRPTWRDCCGGPASSSATCTRTTCMPGPSPTTSGATRTVVAIHARRVVAGFRGTACGRSSRSTRTRRTCCAASTRRSSRATTSGSAPTSRCSPSDGLPFPAPIAEPVVVHDSVRVCAVRERHRAEPRKLLAAAGLRRAASQTNGRELTWCCGGPAEALYPGTRRRLGRRGSRGPAAGGRLRSA